MGVVLWLFGFLLIFSCYGDEDIFDLDMENKNSEGEGEGEGVVCSDDTVCVDAYLCINGVVDEFGVDVIVPRSGICPLVYVCCRPSSKFQASRSSETPPPAVVNVPDCGRRNINGIHQSQRRVALEAEFGEFPWNLLLKGNAKNKVYGGASLIHPQIAMTAAHLVANVTISDLRVHAGVWKINDAQSDSHPIQIGTVSERIIHEQFNRINLKNDIALLFLSRPFELKPHINTICLPPPNFEVGFKKCFLTGWGRFLESEEYSVYPRKFDLPTEDPATCQKVLGRDFFQSRFYRLHKSFMCAGSESETDPVDSGSAFICMHPSIANVYHQIGFFIWVHEDLPGVYGNVPYFRLWVDKKVTEKGFDTSFYIKNERV